MTKYAALGQPPAPGSWDDVAPRALTIMAIDHDSVPVKTGLLDHRDVPIYRMPERVACGFGRRG